MNCGFSGSPQRDHQINPINSNKRKNVIKKLIVAIMLVTAPLFVSGDNESRYIVPDETFDFPKDVREACYKDIPEGGTIFGVGYYTKGLLEIVILYPDGSSYIQMCDYQGKIEFIKL